jgi:hypothetical protein
VRCLEAAVGCRNLPVGVAHPGAISPSTGLLKNSNSTCLNSRPFKQDPEAVLGHEVYLANDADCLAVSEARDGAAAGAANVFAVIRRMGSQPAALDPAGMGGDPRRRVLVRTPWLHRDLAVWRRPRARSRMCDCRASLRRSRRAARRGRGGACRCDAIPLRGPPRACAGARDQPARSGCDCTGRRRVQDGAPVPHGAGPVGSGCSRIPSTPSSCRHCTATPAACGAPRFCVPESSADTTVEY